MPDCPFDRGILQSFLDGESSAADRNQVEAHLRSCQVCREYVERAAWEVGLFSLAGPAADDAASGPSIDFTERVMRRVRTEPREGTARDAPPPLRVLPPSPEPVRWGFWAGAVAAGALAASGAFLLLSGGPDPAIDNDIPETGRPVATARGGGVLRWTGPFDRGLSGSVWIAKDDPTPTLPGEVLHSPESSSIHVRLPEGGRVDAGPSSWLGFGEGGGFALLDGALTLDSGGGSLPVTIDVPGFRVTTRGAAEVSVRAEGGASSDRATAWLAAWAAERRGEAPGAPAAAPKAAILVYARKGPLEVAGSPGPVRNSLERITQGEALVILDGRAFRTRGVDDDAPPERAGWVDGLPVPPDSQFFRKRTVPSEPPAVPPDGIGASGGPVRNSLEKVMEAQREDARRRAYALKVYEGVGGVEAVEAAAKAASDPAVLVRAVAVRVLALNAWADRAKALEGLRRLARDRDAGVARYAILALKTLQDREAIPILRALVVDDDAPPDQKPVPGPAVVDDDAPPDQKPVPGPAVVDDDAPPDQKPVPGPAVVDDDAPPDQAPAPGVTAPMVYPEVAKVYAFDALVSFGDTTCLLQAAALEPRVEKDPALLEALRSAETVAFQLLDFETIRSHVSSPQPGVRAAAIRALQDPSVAKAHLQDPSETVRIAAVELILRLGGPSALDDLVVPSQGSLEFKKAICQSIGTYLTGDPGARAPTWAADLAMQILTTGDPTYGDARWCVPIIARSTKRPELQKLLGSAAPFTLAAINVSGSATRESVGLGIASNDPVLRRDSLLALDSLARGPVDMLSSEEALAIVREFRPSGRTESLYVARIPATLLRIRNHQEAWGLFLSGCQASDPTERAAYVTMLSSLFDRAEARALVVQKLDDSSPIVASAAARSIQFAVQRGAWTSPPIDTLFPSNSPYASVRVPIGLAAWSQGVQGAEETVRDLLRDTFSDMRLEALRSMAWLKLAFSAAFEDLQLDPDPRVRILAILRQQAGTREDTARALMADPTAWVRATALATLAEAGDATADAVLIEMLREGALNSAFLGENVLSVDPGKAGYREQVLSIAEAVCGLETPSIGATGTPARGDAHDLWSRAIVSVNAGTLRTSPDPMFRLIASKTLAQFDSPEAIACLGRASVQSSEGDATVREEALAGFERRVGFRPSRGTLSFLALHRDGVMAVNEILRSISR